MKRSLLPALLALAALPAPALADDPPPDPAVKVTTFLVEPHPDVTDEQMGVVLKSLEAGLKRNTRLEWVDRDARLAEFGQDLPQDQVDAARAALKDGQDALLNLDVPKAVQKLQEAVDGLAKVLPYIKKQELADAMASLAVAYYEGGDKHGGREEFVKLLTWRGDYTYPIDKLPPKYAQMFEDAQKAVDRAGRGSLEIDSDPAGAQAYVDGKYIGVTPCTADGLSAGEHFVTLKKEGFKKAVAPAVASAKKQQKTSIQLQQNEKYLLIEQAMEKVKDTLGQDMIDPDAENLKQVLFIEHAVFVRAAGKGDKVAIEAFLYDLRTRRKLSSTRMTVPLAESEGPMGQLASNLYLNVSYEAELPKPKDAPLPQKLSRTPVYKTWWFWTAAVAVVAAGVGTAVAIVETRKPGCPDGDSCLEINSNGHTTALYTFP